MRILLEIPILMQIGLESLMIEKVKSGGLFLGKYLISWLSKNQSLISLSTIEDEYITTTSCCTQVLWMIKTLPYIKV